MTGPVEVMPSYKFAVLAFPHARGGGSPAGLCELGAGYAVSSGLPEKALETWRGDIGRLHAEELAACTLFLWATAPSNSAGVLNDEDRNLQDHVLRLQLGLIVAVPHFSCGRVTCLGGANSGGVARARTLTSYNRIWHTVGSPEPDLSLTKLKLAARLAEALQAHESYRFRDRMVRTIRTYREACEARYIDDKLHGFVRAAEAFAGSWGNKQFVARLSQVCTGRHKRALRQMYVTRSAIEHLQGPYANMPKAITKKHKHLALLSRCTEAALLARFLLIQYLLNRRLWNHFRSKEQLHAFWAPSSAARAKLWPVRFHYPAAIKSFDPVAANEAMEEHGY